MLISENIAGKSFLKFGSIVKLLRIEKKNDNLFTDFPIGIIIQDGSKRKRSDVIKLTWNCIVYKYYFIASKLIYKNNKI